MPQKGPALAVMDRATTIWEELLAGNARFQAGTSRYPAISISHRESLVTAQYPHTVVVSCADSRVPPEIVFDTNLGELFVVRTAGPTLDDMVLASIEFGVVKLQAYHIVVMTHTNCGAVEATVAALDSGEQASEEDMASTIEGLDAEATMGAGGLIVNRNSVITVDSMAESESRSETMENWAAESTEEESYLPGIVARLAPIIADARREGLTDSADYSRRNALAVVQRLREMPALTGLWQEGELHIHAALYHVETGAVEEISL